MVRINRHGRICSLLTNVRWIPKLDVAGSIPVSRSMFSIASARQRRFAALLNALIALATDCKCLISQGCKQLNASRTRWHFFPILLGGAFRAIRASAVQGSAVRWTATPACSENGRLHWHRRELDSGGTQTLRGLAFPFASFVPCCSTGSSDALSRLRFECNLSSNVRNSHSAAAEASGVPKRRQESFVASAIHDGNPPMVPSGNSQKIYSPSGTSPFAEPGDSVRIAGETHSEP
jgi:hypothetical protein